MFHVEHHLLSIICFRVKIAYITTRKETTMTYTHLLFDLDGTLFNFDAGETYAFHKVCDSFHIPYSDEVLPLYQRINLSYWKAYERGEITPAALAVARFRDFLAAVGKDGDPALMCQLYQTSLGEDCTPIHDALRVCSILHERGYKFSIITNGRSTTQHSRLSHSELTPMISDLFISEELGCQKPKKEFFDAVFSKLQISVSKALVIGDSLTSDIIGGIQYGIDTCWFNPNGSDNTMSQAPTYEIKQLSELLSIL